jgi:hypothetical protein
VSIVVVVPWRVRGDSDRHFDFLLHDGARLRGNASIGVVDGLEAEQARILDARCWLERGRLPPVDAKPGKFAEISFAGHDLSDAQSPGARSVRHWSIAPVRSVLVIIGGQASKHSAGLSPVAAIWHLDAIIPLEISLRALDNLTVSVGGLRVVSSESLEINKSRNSLT